jgi:hypothetical protein
LNGFAQIGISVKVDWVGQFWGFAGATSIKHHQRPPKLGRGEANLLIGSIIAQFRVL